MKNENDALAPGTRVGQFVVERFLGLGGFGVTYLVRDESLGVYRALKEYLPDKWGTRFGDGTVGPPTEGRAADYEWGLERFLHEARMLAQFRHSHIAQVHQVLEGYNGTAYMVMEYVEGRTLSEEVRAEGPLPESRVRGLLLSLTEGLSAVHAKELLHRDIKPDNVMIRRDGTPVLIDFGSARRAMGARSSEVTEFYAPHFTPIEQYGAGAHEDAAPDAGLRQGPWTDIYALGAVAYWALSGKLPLQAPARALTDSQRPLRQLAPQVSEGLASAVESAMAVRPRDRPQSLEEWRALLLPGRVAERGGTSASASGGVPFGPAEDEGAREESRGPAWHWWLSGAAVAVVAVSAAWWFAQGSREPMVASGDEAPASARTAPAPSPDARLSASAEEDEQAVEPGDVDAGPVSPTVPSAAAPAPDPAAVEAGLGLERADWRLIQEGLRAEGFSPGSADGRPGSGTRAAIRARQEARGQAATGFLDGASEAALRAAGASARRIAADRREEAEEERRRVEAGLGLDRASLRLIELGLASSGLEPGLVDGVVGSDTRQALRGWQSSRGESATGYLDATSASALRTAGRNPRAGTVFRECGVCPELVVIPAGEFVMGSPGSEAGRNRREGPQRRVRVELFALGRYEVTRAEYAAFASATGRDINGCYAFDGDESWDWSARASWRSPGFPQTDDHPAVCVSWDDASAYVRWLSRETGRQYRLPSESEWEYAARAGTSTSRYWGSSGQCGNANGADAAGKQRFEGWNAVSCDDGRVFTAPVGTFTANRFGLFDMLGNVWEWIEDCRHDNYQGAPDDGRAWTSGGDCGRRVLRGGSWRGSLHNLRAASRHYDIVRIRVDHIGLRVARTPD